MKRSLMYGRRWRTLRPTNSSNISNHGYLQQQQQQQGHHSSDHAGHRILTLSARRYTTNGLLLNQRRSFGSGSSGSSSSSSSSSTNEASIESSKEASSSSASSSSWWIGGIDSSHSESESAATTLVSSQEQHQQQQLIKKRQPIQAFPQSPRRSVPSHIQRPPYAATGHVPLSRYPEHVYLHDAESIARMRRAAQMACQALHLACNTAASISPTMKMTTDDIDVLVHDYLIQHGAYPSPLNYAGFPKSLCSSINEVICHGIPDTRPLEFGDVVSFDVSCFIDGVHGDNCATVIVGDEEKGSEGHGGGSAGGGQVDWRGVPYKTDLTDVITISNSKKDAFTNQALQQQQQQQQQQLASLQAQLESSRRLIRATRESLYAAIETCRPDSCLSDIGAAIETIAKDYGYSSVQKYRGHGICHEFHCAPYVKHYKNLDKLPLRKGMIFTIEPMLVANPDSADCYEWDDDWTVVTKDGSCAAQFEHTILITDTGHEILTQLPDNEK